jgi:ammonium transporter, Amt family
MATHKIKNQTVLEVESEIIPGDTAWMMMSTVLVLFMTLPGLILYYSGMIRIQNVLATAMQIFSITCLISALWMFFGYSLAFAPAHGHSSSFIYGDTSRFWLLGMHPTSTHQLAPNIPESLFCSFQMTFAIIAPSLIVGSFADRMKFIPMLIFMALWHLLVYCPIAHSIWHPDGFLFKAGALDFAGGTVVHISSGMSGLISTLVIGNRQGFGDEEKKHLTAPHNILFTVMGSCMLWVGWFGFNAGSSMSAGVLATNAFLNTFLSSSFGAIAWLLTEWYFRSKIPLPHLPSFFHTTQGSQASLEWSMVPWLDSSRSHQPVDMSIRRHLISSELSVGSFAISALN